MFSPTWRDNQVRTFVRSRQATLSTLSSGAIFLSGLLLAGAPAALGTAMAAPQGANSLDVREAGMPRPHALRYEITLHEAQERSGIIAADGVLASRLRGGSCEGWTSDSRMQVRFVFRRLGVRETDTRVSSWESDSGDTYYGVLQRSLNGRMLETYRVRARRTRPGAPFALRMLEPKRQDGQLPASTLFPTGALKRVLRAAHEGERTISLLLYEGDDEMAPQQVVVTIGGRRTAIDAAARTPPEHGDEAGERDTGDLALLARMPYWPVSMAYYGPPRADEKDDARTEGGEEALIREEARRRGVPEYEVSFRLYENGITGDALLIYDDYVLRARVVELKLLPAAACPPG